jgi:hypothetical protein
MSSGFYTDGKARDAVRLLSSQLATDLKEPLSQAMAERAAKLLGESRSLSETVQDAKRLVTEVAGVTQKSVAAADQAQSAAQRTEAVAANLAKQVVQDSAERGSELIARAHEKADKALGAVKGDIDRAVKAAAQAGEAATTATQAAEDAQVAALGAAEAASGAAKAANEALVKADKATQAATHATAEVRESSKELREAHHQITLATQSLTDAKASTAGLVASTEQAAVGLKEAAMPLAGLSAQISSTVGEIAAIRRSMRFNQGLLALILFLQIVLCGLGIALVLLRMK